MISRFDNIRVVLAGPKASLRNDIVEALRKIGFSDIKASGNLSAVREAIEEESADLLIVDTSLPEGDVNKLIYRMRHGEVGANPFLVVVTLVDKPTKELINETINSGSDDIAVKPFSMDYLCQRILNLTHSRKRFVVTTDYIGPDRRDKRRLDDDMEVPQIIVPNPLRIRITGQVGGGKMRRSIETAAATINEQKVQRHGYQINYLIERILPAIRGGEVTDQTTQYLDKLHTVAQDISKRSKGSSFAHVREMTMTLVNMVENVRRDPTNAHEMDIALLEKLGGIIKESFDPERNEKRDKAGREIEKQKRAEWAEESRDDFFDDDEDEEGIDGRDPDELEEEMLAAAGG